MPTPHFNITAYTDGACRGNPGPAGIGVVLRCSKSEREISKPIGNSTNNRAEMQAVIEAMQAIHQPERCSLTIYTDSKLVLKTLTGEWQAKKNLDLLETAQDLMKQFADFSIKFVKAHAGNPGNTQADYLATTAIGPGGTYNDQRNR
ncbi:unnamed protein product [marine sediment metagenome]|uniref:ribonuclease H n=1 Tax=marine sediment metagenome TaxID=412755 RepID=X1F4V8_9ZZZZ